MKYIWTTQTYRPQVQTLEAIQSQTAVLERVETTAGEIKKKSIAELTADLSQLINKPVMEWAFEAEDVPNAAIEFQREENEMRLREKPDCTYGQFIREMTQE